jgi:hypothetical protein
MRYLSFLPVLAAGIMAFSAHAESYDGVHTGVRLLARDAVAGEAVATAHAPNQNVTRGSRGADPFVPTAARETVYRDAVAAAHAPDQNVGSGSRVNSVVVSTLPVKASVNTASDSQL